MYLKNIPDNVIPCSLKMMVLNQILYGVDCFKLINPVKNQNLFASTMSEIKLLKALLENAEIDSAKKHRDFQSKIRTNK
mgnify:CR=1 FL=1